MIEDLHLQTDSVIPAIRGWGCYYKCLESIGCDVAGRALTVKESDDLFISLLSSGAIISNSIKVGHAGWFRSFVKEPWLVIRKAGLVSNNATLSAREVYRGPSIDIPRSEVTHTIAEMITQYGSHFVLVNIYEDGKFKILYNPDPRIDSVAVRSIRHWIVSKDYD